MVLDPLSALSLAGNVVQFIEFASSILSESRRIYQSGAESSENVALESVADSLLQFSARLKIRPPGNDEDDSDTTDAKIPGLLESCEEVATELLRAVQRVKPKDGHHRKWNSFRQALASVWQKEKLNGMQGRLSFLREQVNLHIVSTVSEQQIKILKTLRNLRKDTNSMNVDETQKLANIAAALDQVQVSRNSMPTKDDLDQIRHIFQNTSSAAAEVSKTVRILQSLRYDSMSLRHSRIVEAHKKTLNWVFDQEGLLPNDARSQIGLKRWLLSRDGIFWISGKSGSGKSTLMKHLSDDPRTAKYLRKWAGGSKLSIASFYFWNAGTDMQKSQQGLLQSILFEILSQSPDILPEVCEARWEASEFQDSFPWKPAELTKAFENLQSRASTKRKFCFLIDGLDEYEGDHFELLETMISIVKSPHIKLCLSSRPWNCFEDALGAESDRKLYMQDLTREDIEMYAGDKLRKPLTGAWTHEHHIQHRILVLDIVERAQGVFLWVYLVVRSLQEGLVNGDNIAMLHTRLRTLPTDLEAYFEYILKSVDGLYREKLACMLQNTLPAKEPLNLLLYSFLDEDDPDFAIKLAPAPFGIPDIDSRQKAMRRRITGRSKGLLEVAKNDEGSSNGSLYFEYRVEFLHRTVRDFLNTEHMQSYLRGMIPSTYNTSFALSRGFLACLKTIPYDQQTVLGMATKPKDINYFRDEAWNFARIADDQRGLSDVPMLQELERTGKCRFRMFLVGNTAFLECAIKKGIINFVKDMTQQPHKSQNGDVLLGAALGTFDSEMWDHSQYAPNFVPMVQLLLQANIGVNVQAAFQSLEFLVVRQSGVDHILAEAVRILELLLSHGLNPNEPVSHGRTVWTKFLELVCLKQAYVDPVVIVGFTKAFLMYGADPLATYCGHDLNGNPTWVYSVSEVVTKYIAPLDTATESSIANILAKQIADLINRDTGSKKRNRSQSREPRKRQDVRGYR